MRRPAGAASPSASGALPRSSDASWLPEAGSVCSVTVAPAGGVKAKTSADGVGRV